jgi:hypothetical protein
LLERRSNPGNGQDKTYQYRLRWDKVQAAIANQSNSVEVKVKVKKIQNPANSDLNLRNSLLNATNSYNPQQSDPPLSKRREKFSKKLAKKKNQVLLSQNNKLVMITMIKKKNPRLRR